MTIHEARQQLISDLVGIYDTSEAANIAELVTEHITGWLHTERIKNKEILLSPNQLEHLDKIIERLKQNEPVQYALEEAWFAGMKFHVDKNVLIPRTETEELVEWVVKDINIQHSPLNKQYSIIDIGTGSGCIPISIKKKISQADVSAVDVCSEALFVATNNAINLEADVNFILLDFLDENKWNELGRYDIIVSNPPYVRQNEATAMHLRVTGFEPHLALFVPDNDALIFYKAIAAFGNTYLKPGGCIYVEINEASGKEITELFRSNNYSSVELKKDMQGKDRMIKVISGL